MTDAKTVDELYVKKDTLSARVGLHEKHSVNPYGFGNWTFDKYRFAEGMRILELGCGGAGIWNGREECLPQNIEIVLSDFSPLMVTKAEALLQNNPRFKFMIIDIRSIPFEDAFFDAVIANHMLYHVPDIQQALREVSRVLKPGGRFYATTVGRDTYKELSGIYRQMDNAAAFSYAENLSFLLENGAAVLSPYFSQVTQEPYIDALVVTDAEDLLAYIHSYNTVPAGLESKLESLVRASFTDGVFRIRKEQGMFICIK